MKRPKARWLVKNVWIVPILFLIVVVLIEMQVNLDLKRELQTYSKKEHIVINQFKLDEKILFSDTIRIECNDTIVNPNYKTHINKF